MLTIVLFLQLWVIQASVIKRDELNNNTVSALSDYPEYDTTAWTRERETTPRQFAVESEEVTAPVAVIKQQKREKFLSTAMPPMKRHPMLSTQASILDRVEGKVGNAQHPGYGAYEYQGGYGSPHTGGYDYDGYESAGYRPYQGIVMGHPRIKGYQANPRTNYYQQYQGGYSSPMGYSYAGYIEKQARRFPIMMYTLVKCVPCQRAKHLLAVSYSDIAAHFLELVGDEDWQRQLQVDLQQITRQVTFPYIFICGQHIGGSSDLFSLHQSGQLRQMLNNCAPRR